MNADDSLCVVRDEGKTMLYGMEAGLATVSHQVGTLLRLSC